MVSSFLLQFPPLLVLDGIGVQQALQRQEIDCCKAEPTAACPWHRAQKNQDMVSECFTTRLRIRASKCFQAKISQVQSSTMQRLLMLPADQDQTSHPKPSCFPCFSCPLDIVKSVACCSNVKCILHHWHMLPPKKKCLIKFDQNLMLQTSATLTWMSH